MLHSISIHGPDFPAWRYQARRLLGLGVPPDQVLWSDGGVLFNQPTSGECAAGGTGELRVPKDFVSLATLVAFHRDGEKWPLLYRTLWRLTHGEPHLLQVAVDDDTRHLTEMAKSVRRDAHKMHAFVRF